MSYIPINHIDTSVRLECEADPHIPPVMSELSNIKEIGREDHKGFVRKHKTALALGASALSIAATGLNGSIGESLRELKESAPLLAVGITVGEIAWIGGAATMLAATGEAVGINPFKIRSKFSDIKNKAKNSTLFKVGYWTNTVAALGQSGIITTSVVGNMPFRSWGLLALPALDLAATISLRRIIYKSISD